MLMSEVEDRKIGGDSMDVQGEGSRCDVNRKELRNLDGDLLIEVFSYLKIYPSGPFSKLCQ